jgi:hypothetical protein
MNDWEDMLKSYWGDQLRRYNDQEISLLNIDDESKAIIRQVGLPEISVNDVVVFEPSRVLEQIAFRDEMYTKLGSNVTDGETLGIFVALKESSSEIYQLHIKHNDAIFFMNSNLKSLLLFLKSYSDFILSGQELTEEQVTENEELLAKLRAEFLSVDPKALSGSNHYWTLELGEFKVY